MKELDSQEFYYAETKEEKEKEQKLRSALHAILPITMGGKEDKTNYVIRNENETRTSMETPPIVKNNPPSTIPTSPDTKKEATTFENPKNDFNFDPWQREKTLDSMRVVKYPKLFGEMGTHVYPRANYHSKEEFDYINTTKFSSIIDKNLEHEGGYVNNKNDRGGKTKYGITAGRMKTGTPVRLDKRSIDISLTEVQDGDNDFHRFSYGETKRELKQLPCWGCYTNPEVHTILRDSLDDSPLYKPVGHLLAFSCR